MTRYVLGFLFDPQLGRVVLIEKNKPDWQKGYYNGIGGKIEPGETDQEAMSREFMEEAGLYIPTVSWKRFCSMIGQEWEVICFMATNVHLDVTTTTREKVVVVAAHNVSHLRVLNNVPWLIEMAKAKHEELTIVYP